MPAPDELFQGMQIFGSTAIADSRYIVIRDNAEYQAFWYEHHRGMSPVPPLPTFNFTGYMLVGIVLGLVDDCHFVVPRGIVRVPTVGAADHIEVSYAVQDPGDACRNHRIPGSRILLEAMRRTDLPIVFVQVPR